MLSWYSVPILGSKFLSSLSYYVKNILNYLREMLLSKAFVSACTPKQTFPIITWTKQKKFTWLQSACVLCILSGVQSSVYLTVIKSESSYDEVQLVGTGMFSSVFFSFFFNILAQYETHWFSDPNVRSPNATIINKRKKQIYFLKLIILLFCSPQILVYFCFL